MPQTIFEEVATTIFWKAGNALVVEHGFLRRRSASVSLNGTVFEVERTLLGRILGYGTVIAGELEIDWVPRRITRLLQKRR